MSNQTIELLLKIEKENDNDVTYLTQNLLDGVNHINIDSAQIKISDLQASDAKGLDPIWGTVLVALGAPVLTELIKFLTTWVSHHKNPITLKFGPKSTIEVTIDPDMKPEKLNEIMKIIQDYRK